MGHWQWLFTRWLECTLAILQVGTMTDSWWGSGVVVDMVRLAVYVNEPGSVWIHRHADNVCVVRLHHRQIGVQRLILDVVRWGKGDQVRIVANVLRHRIGKISFQTNARIWHDARSILVWLMVHFDVFRIFDWFLFLPAKKVECN